MWLLISQGGHQETFLRKAERRDVSCLRLTFACSMGKSTVILQRRITGARVTQNTLMFLLLGWFWAGALHTGKALALTVRNMHSSPAMGDHGAEGDQYDTVLPKTHPNEPVLWLICHG